MPAAFEVTVVVIVLFGTLLCLIKEWLAPELAAMSGFAALLVFGVLREEDIGPIFGNAAAATIGAMFVLSAALVNTGVVDLLAAKFRALTKGSEVRALVLLVVIAMPASALLNNTPVVIVFLPIVLATCRTTGLHATRLLLPLSFLSILGGTTTLLGTSTNLLVAGAAASAGQEPFTVFEITPLGLVYAAVGALYMVLIGRHLLPAADTVSSTLDLNDMRRFYSAIQVEAGSPLIGKRLVESRLLKGPQKLSIYQVVRYGHVFHVPLSQVVIQADDVYWIRASASAIAQAETLPGVRLMRREDPENEDEGSDKLDAARAGDVLVVEALIGPESRLIGKTLKRAALRQRYGILVAAMHRRGRNMMQDFETIPLAFGDTLILEGPAEEILELHAEDDLLSLQELDVAVRRRRKAPLAIGTMLAVITCSALGVISITAAALAGAVFVVLTRCMDIKDALAAVDWSILFLIYGMLAIGTGMEKSGAAAMVAEGVTGWLAPLGPYFVLAAVYVLASVLTELVTNNAVAILLTPIVVGIAESLGLNARPFIVAIMFGASASFLTPIGYQTNTYVFGAGNYRFRDFLRVGVPLSLLLAVLATLLIPVIWPF